MTPRAYTPTQRLIWLPLIARLAQAAEHGPGALARALTGAERETVMAVAIACDVDYAAIEALEPEPFLDLLGQVMAVNAHVLEAAHGAL